MISWLLALYASSQVPYELLALVFGRDGCTDLNEAHLVIDWKFEFPFKSQK